MSKITQAVILSAGLGTRLREVTGDEMPKVMVPFLGKPLLEWHIEQFKKHNVKEFFVNLHHLPEAIIRYFGDGSKWGLIIHYCLEQPKILGTAGGIKDFEGRLKGNFFVIYGDIMGLVDYTRMAETFMKKPGAIGMELIGESDHPQDSDLAKIDGTLRFVKIYPKPHKRLPTHYKAMRGVYIFHERILKYIPLNAYYEIDHDLLPEILKKGEKFYGYEPSKEEFIKDIGTPERYRQVTEYLNKKSGSV